MILKNQINLCDGRSKTRLYSIYYAMKNRCMNNKMKHYKNYGGRGIKVCQEWLDSFDVFRDWALSSGYNDSLSIDRIDVNGIYEPSNCRWATHKEQATNRRTSYWHKFTIEAFGEKKNLNEWLEDERCGVKQVGSILYRLGTGMSPEEAISKKSSRII